MTIKVSNSNGENISVGSVPDVLSMVRMMLENSDAEVITIDRTIPLSQNQGPQKFGG